jgi:gamma-glutamylcyclotransferase (GGCT)/AIG2-like uncharacterized protein YtfP
MHYQPVFVYGTLMPGHHNHARCLDGRIASCTPAVADGVGLYRSRTLPYAAPASNRSTHGVLVELRPDTYPSTIRDLDDLEGYRPAAAADSHYVRALRSVHFVDAETGRPTHLQAWIYLAGPSMNIPALQPIPTGRWANN